jgi:hypothetical protein
VLERHVRVRPELLAKGLAPDDLSGVFNQCLQDFEGFLFKLDAHAVLANLPQFEGNFECAKTSYQGQALHVIHGRYPGDLPGLDPGCPPLLPLSLNFLT